MAVAVCRGVCPLCGPGYPAAPIARGPDFEYRTTGDQEFDVRRCETCATFVLDPRPADAAIAALYPPEYEPYRFDALNPIVRMGRDAVQRRKTRLLAAQAPAGGTIVDVGCGGGSLLRLMHADHPGRFRLVGWDYPGPHLDRLAEAGVEVIAAPIEDVHAPQADLFVLNQVIEHVPYPDRLVRALAGALRPGGRLVIETPDTDGLDARWFRARHWGGYHFPRHMILFNRANLRTLVERAGLRVIHTAHLASPAFWVQSLHHTAVDSPAPWLAPLCTLRNAPLVALCAAWDTMRARVAATSNQRLVAERPA